MRVYTGLKGFKCTDRCGKQKFKNEQGNVNNVRISLTF